MVNFTKLKLLGFKSFVEPTELPIRTGLTGIVGPNGCGKSNLVEALRWVMGETSAKRMRGSGMEDVIFNGTSDRPARNIAEVHLAVNNSDRKAPAAFADFDEIDITRRIERNKGSNYRANGKEVRARDVQLLFADLASGAGSSALVGQGKIGALINAKATERRSILEEAAGITGLYSRRHEAELRLRAAETNLTRLEDVMDALGSQLRSLKKQTQQANRYREISTQIRRQQALLFYVDWLTAKEAQEKANNAYNQAEQAVAQRIERVASASREQTEAASALPELRKLEAEAGAALQRLLVERDRLTQEKNRIAQEKAKTAEALDQAKSDVEREEKRFIEAEHLLLALEREQLELEKDDSIKDGEVEAAKETAEKQQGLVQEIQLKVTELTRQKAQFAADQAAAQRRLSELSRQKEQAESKLTQFQGRLKQLEEKLIEPDLFDQIKTEAQKAGNHLDQVRENLESAESQLANEREQSEEGRLSLQEVEGYVQEILAEIKGLEALSQSEGGEIEGEPVLGQIKVQPGFETALAAAMGAFLDYPLASADGTSGWRSGSTAAPAFSSSQKTLGQVTEAPTAIGSALASVAVVESDEDGDRLQASLVAGQSLVSKSGRYWRWDGLHLMPGQQDTSAAVKLEQKNRLELLRKDLVAREADLEVEKSRQEAANEKLQRVVETERSLRDQVKEAYKAYTEAKDKQSNAEKDNSNAQTQLDSVLREIERLKESLDEVSAANEIAVKEAETSDAQESLDGEISTADATLDAARADLAEKNSHYIGLTKELELKQQRAARIANEITQWNQRKFDAERHKKELAVRVADLTATLSELATAPDTITEKLNGLAEIIDQASIKRKKMGDNLATGETRQREADEALRDAERAASEARETRARLDAEKVHSKERMDDLLAQIHDRLAVAPEKLPELAEVNPEDKLPPRGEIQTKYQRFIRERDAMGAVNLRAEQETEELRSELVQMESEQADLMAAIEKLRGSISELNKEGRARLLEAFELVNERFGTLFTKLFGGGAARLELIGSADPLEAGLEIMASPPGKKLQTISLLSGGEQTMTAIALLFAVFMTNPAPICVLDEVDAPLDEANVNRFCGMVSEIADQTGTAFLVITHNPVTMARMDRLFGVTMAERGVSQLLSVDLQAASKMRAAE